MEGIGKKRARLGRFHGRFSNKLFEKRSGEKDSESRSFEVERWYEEREENKGGKQRLSNVADFLRGGISCS